MMAYPAAVTDTVADTQSSYAQSQTQHQRVLTLTADEEALLEAYRLLEPVDREDLVGELLRRADRIRRYVVKVQSQKLEHATELPVSDG